MLIVSSALPQELGYWFCSQSLRLSSLLEWLPHEQQGLDLHSNLNSVSWPTVEQIVVNFYLLWNTLDSNIWLWIATWPMRCKMFIRNNKTNCVKFRFALGLLKMTRLRQTKEREKETISTLIKSLTGPPGCSGDDTAYELQGNHRLKNWNDME